jgi:hypothetical protein
MWWQEINPSQQSDPGRPVRMQSLVGRHLEIESFPILAMTQYPILMNKMASTTTDPLITNVKLRHNSLLGGLHCPAMGPWSGYSIRTHKHIEEKPVYKRGCKQMNIIAKFKARMVFGPLEHWDRGFEFRPRHWCMKVYPKVSGLNDWSENCKWYSSLPLGVVVSLFCESV